MDELVAIVKTKLQERPDPQDFALWIKPKLNYAIERVETPEEANGLRGIADMARVYLRQALPMVMRDRSECLKQMYPVEEEYVKVCGKAGLLYKPENSLPGSNFHNAGFISSRDATTCIRIGELIEDGELETYFEHTKENYRHITVGGAESAWHLLYGKGGKKIPLYKRLNSTAEKLYDWMDEVEGDVRDLIVKAWEALNDASEILKDD